MPPNGYATSSRPVTSRREMSTSGQLSMFDLPTWSDIGSATSSRASAGGALQLVSPDGPTTVNCGPGHAPASRSVQRAPAVASTTLGTSGPSGSGLSPSDVLQQSWGSSLRERLRGSDWCEVIWKPWATPWGQCLSKPRARERGNCETGIGLLPALTTRDNLLSPSMQKWPFHRRLAPALIARDWKSCSPSKRPNSRPLSEHIGGPLNPLWASWHMGFPDVWIRSAPSAMPSTSAQRQR